MLGLRDLSIHTGGKKRIEIYESSRYRDIALQDHSDTVTKEWRLKDENGQPYFYALTSEEIFDKTFDPDRDPEHFKKMVEYHCFRLSGGLDPENLKRIDTQIRQMLLAAKSFRDHYLFCDIYNQKTGE